jgi:hypothetical protein
MSQIKIIIYEKNVLSKILNLEKKHFFQTSSNHTMTAFPPLILIGSEKCLRKGFEQKLRQIIVNTDNIRGL